MSSISKCCLMKYGPVSDKQVHCQVLFSYIKLKKYLNDFIGAGGLRL